MLDNIYYGNIVTTAWNPSKVQRDNRCYQCLQRLFEPREKPPGKGWWWGRCREKLGILQSLRLSNPTRFKRWSSGFRCIRHSFMPERPSDLGLGKNALWPVYRSMYVRSIALVCPSMHLTRFSSQTKCQSNNPSLSISTSSWTFQYKGWNDRRHDTGTVAMEKTKKPGMFSPCISVPHPLFSLCPPDAFIIKAMIRDDFRCVITSLIDFYAGIRNQELKEAVHAHAAKFPPGTELISSAPTKRTNIIPERINSEILASSDKVNSFFSRDFLPKHCYRTCATF